MRAMIQTVAKAALSVSLLIALNGCNDSGSASLSTASQKKGPVKAGADKDAHGCIGSAGFKWCAKTNKCERPWELAKEENFEKSAEAFDSFCRNKK